MSYKGYIESQKDQLKQLDSLYLIFRKQLELSEYLANSKPGNYYHFGEERYPYERLNHLMTAISDEISEVRAGLNWKWWKSYTLSAPPLQDKKESFPEDLDTTIKQLKENSQKSYLKKELIDILHFWVQACLELGMDSDEVRDRYIEKHKENHERQQNGY